jgi:hypothetical protein
VRDYKVLEIIRQALSLCKAQVLCESIHVFHCRAHALALQQRQEATQSKALLCTTRHQAHRLQRIS